MTTKTPNINNEIQRDDYELDQKQVARILRVSTKTVRNWANKKPKKPGDPHLSKQMLLDANRAPTPRYSKSEVRELKKQLAEKQKTGKKPESSAAESGISALETNSIMVPDFDISDFPDEQKPFVFMVHQATSERRSLQAQLNEQIKKTSKLENELELKNREIELIDEKRKAQQEEGKQTKPDPEMIEQESPQTEKAWKYVVWIFASLVLIGLLFYLFLLNPTLFQR